MGLHISKPDFLHPALHGGTLFRFVLMLRLFCFNTKALEKIDAKMLPSFAETADGLCCRLAMPCFIQGLDNAEEARPIPITTRRPTIKWKEISRCGFTCTDVFHKMSLCDSFFSAVFPRLASRSAFSVYVDSLLER